VVFCNERGEVTESSIANVVIVRGGEKLTPPRASGLLAGTFRAELLAAGEIRERVLTRDELRKADEIYLINSVQKWMRAQLVDS
jgi:para-aminobenzoate synthetase/4-amino-4-deoxychorismate lyase